MSKQEYTPPTGQPPSWSEAGGSSNNHAGYVPQAQPSYNQNYQQRGYQPQYQQGPPQGYYQQQQGYPPQQGGYPPQQGGYYQQQQPVYVQQQRQSNNDGCLMACLAALCICCTLDVLF
ncbi:cysteine-rich and transmembrane domain-containing protein [[Candida] railenensis]|uniref:Cysteine-rich and transmembrane domain-containing protein n=1 Tax=[Candida] railenensis TaxID=45579 RepID=A0A9P0VYW0_9ASCO|nr:cysteine-rich and transmembrane domain-containing protein [[Candida] railenensis]